jgi:uncharacterized membrane protein
MRSIGSWRVSTWLIVLWSGLCAFAAAVLIVGMATVCVGKTDTGTPTCQDWANLFFGVILFVVIMAWLVGLVLLIVVWETSRPDGGQGSRGKRGPQEGTPHGACVACGARVADVREICPRCGHSPQEGYDSWGSTS